MVQHILIYITFDSYTMFKIWYNGENFQFEFFDLGNTTDHNLIYTGDFNIHYDKKTYGEN